MTESGPKDAKKRSLRGNAIKRMPDIERFWTLVDRSGGPNACWPWTKTLTKAGYGRFRVHPKTYLATRWIMAHILGRPLRWDDEVQEYVCHHCDNPPCVNPRHLYVGDQSTNMHDCSERGRHYWARKTHCPQGHPYTPENTYLHGGRRTCRTCALARARQRQARKAAEQWGRSSLPGTPDSSGAT